MNITRTRKNGAGKELYPGTPSKHPRDDAGRFKKGGGSGSRGEAAHHGAPGEGGKTNPPPIPKELFHENTVIQKKPPSVPVVEKQFGVSQGKPAAVGHALQAVNPNFYSKKRDATDDVYKKNCQNCAVAYELQRRGYKVTALPHSGKAVNGEISNAFQVFDLDKRDYQIAGRGRTDLENELKKPEYPDGSRFVISQELKFDNEYLRHNYVAEKINGTIRYFDPQDGRPDASSTLKKIRIRKGKYQLFFARVDDKPLRETIDYTKVVKPADKK